MSSSGSLSDLFSTLNRLAEKLGELADDDGGVDKTVRFGKDGDRFNGVFGLHVRTGVDRSSGPSSTPGSGVTVEPFGNVRTDADTGEVVVEETREPVVDVYDEDDHVRIVAEMPGVTAEDVSFAADGDVGVLEAATDRHRYRKDLLLPHPVDASGVTIRAANGIVDVLAPVVSAEE